MSSRTYPYEAWALSPSFAPKLVLLAGPYWSIGDWDVSESGKLYSMLELFPTKEAALVQGWQRIADQEAKLAKLQVGIAKKKAALAKAAT